MRTILASFAVFLSLAVSALAEVTILSAPDAQAKLSNGEIILLDIRSRDEWQETGLAQGAWPVSMHEKDFGPRLQAILQNYEPDQIALICATGGRTARVSDFLEKNGVTGVIDVSEGMMGNRRGAGWIKRGLPIVTLDEAKTTYKAAIADW